MSLEDLLGRGRALAEAGQHEDALNLARQAAALDPGRYEPHALAGAILALAGRPDEALSHLERARQLDPMRPELYNNAGAALRSLGRLDEALAHFERALSLHPGYADAAANAAGVWGARGLALAEEGDIDGAARALRVAIRLAPENAKYYRHLTDIDVNAITPEHEAALGKLARSPRHDDTQADADFALGTILRARDPQRSFDHFVRANALKRSQQTYDEAETLGAFERIATTFDRAFLDRHAGYGDRSERPIFIVGMPRSGTTLIEQILASHPLVFGAGELGTFEEITNAVLADGDMVSPAAMLEVHGEQLDGIGRRYDEALRALAPGDVGRVTDKMPSNFRFIGLIRLALPNARIIHVQRDIIDVALSCFTTSFTAEGMAWTGDLSELGRYARGYLRLMNHWRTTLGPSEMLEVRYEDLVGDLEGEARRILTYCGLAWDERCLNFHDTKRPVRTASVVQVRRPVYRTSIGGWRDFSSQLQPFIDALG